MNDLTEEECKYCAAVLGLSCNEVYHIHQILRERLNVSKKSFLAIGDPTKMLRCMLEAYDSLKEDSEWSAERKRIAISHETELQEWKDRALDICVQFLKGGRTAEELAAAINGGGWVVGQKLINDIDLNDRDKEYLADILTE